MSIIYSLLKLWLRFKQSVENWYAGFKNKHFNPDKSCPIDMTPIDDLVKMHWLGIFLLESAQYLDDHDDQIQRFKDSVWSKILKFALVVFAAWLLFSFLIQAPDFTTVAYQVSAWLVMSIMSILAIVVAALCLYAIFFLWKGEAKDFIPKVIIGVVLALASWFGLRNRAAPWVLIHLPVTSPWYYVFLIGLPVLVIRIILRIARRRRINPLEEAGFLDADGFLILDDKMEARRFHFPNVAWWWGLVFPYLQSRYNIEPGRPRNYYRHLVAARLVGKCDMVYFDLGVQGVTEDPRAVLNPKTHMDEMMLNTEVPGKFLQRWLGLGTRLMGVWKDQLYSPSSDMFPSRWHSRFGVAIVQLQLISIGEKDIHVYLPVSVRGMRLKAKDRLLNQVYVREEHQAFAHAWGLLVKVAKDISDRKNELKRIQIRKDVRENDDAERSYAQQTLTAPLGGSGGSEDGYPYFYDDDED